MCDIIYRLYTYYTGRGEIVTAFVTCSVCTHHPYAPTVRYRWTVVFTHKMPYIPTKRVHSPSSNRRIMILYYIIITAFSAPV